MNLILFVPNLVRLEPLLKKLHGMNQRYRIFFAWKLLFPIPTMLAASEVSLFATSTRSGTSTTSLTRVTHREGCVKVCRMAMLALGRV